MMNLAQRVLLILIPIALVVFAVSLVKARNAAAEADRALARLAVVHQQVDVIEQLRAKTPAWAQRGRPSLGQGGLATAVNDVLAAAGVPASTLSSLSPAAESFVGIAGGSGEDSAMTAFRRRAVLTLAPVTLPQTGAVLQAWREAHPDWTIASVDLSPEPTGRNAPAPAPGSDLLLRAVIGIETLYVDSSASSPSAGARR